jgi:hypothetical protein
MNIKNLRQLHGWGFNTPKYVMSPGKTIKRDAVHVLKELFLSSESVSLLSEREDGEVSRHDSDLSILDAYMRSQAFEERFFVTAIVETIPVDFSGFVFFERQGGGWVQWSVPKTPHKVKFVFNYPEGVPDLVMRHIVRESQRVRDCVWNNNPDTFVKVSWKWSKYFLGVNDSRLVIYKYEIS